MAKRKRASLELGMLGMLPSGSGFNYKTGSYNNNYGSCLETHEISQKVQDDLIAKAEAKRKRQIERFRKGLKK